MSSTSLPEILDVTSGFRNMWFNKNDPDTLYCDLRTNRQLKAASAAYGKGGRKYKAVIPTMAASYCFLPFKDESFMLIQADPPHLYRLGKTSLFRLKYGGLEIGTWQLELKMMTQELWRVLAPGGTITLKWCDRDVPLMEVLRLFPCKPRYGQLSAHGKASNTYWVTFHKPRVKTLKCEAGTVTREECDLCFKWFKRCKEVQRILGGCIQ